MFIEIAAHEDEKPEGFRFPESRLIHQMAGL